jgi:glycosyltransferase involved in cell wall biosynthesis
MLDAVREADRVVVVEAGLAERLVERGLPRGRLRVIPMGVDEDVFRPRPQSEARRLLGLPEEERIVLFVGRPTPEKGIEVLEHALDGLGNGIRVVAVGPPGPPGRIEYVGPEPPERVALWLGAADALCLPSFAEAMPVSVVEALASGRPVVASDVGGIAQQVDDGRTGLLVPPGDPGALAGALREALARSWDHDELRAASQPFWWSVVSPRLAELYAELLA